MEKLTTVFVEKFLYDKDIELLGRYIHSTMPIHVKCVNCSYEWQPLWTNIYRSKCGCKKCVFGVGGVVKSLNKIIKEKDGTMVGEYINSRTAFLVKCNKDKHEWRATYKSIKRGHWCKKCAGQVSATYEEVKQFVNDRGFKFLSKEYKNTKTKLNLQCNRCDYKWKTNYSHIKGGTGCPKCAGVVSPLYKEVKMLIESKNGILLSNEYKNNNTKLHIECKNCDTKWKTSWIVLYNIGSWCPRCAGVLKYTHEEVVKTLKDKDITVLSNYIDCKKKINLQCNKCDYKWKSTFDNVKNQKYFSCSECSSGGEQKRLYEHIKEIFPNYKVLYNYRGLEWLTSDKGRRLEIDIYLPDIGIAIEYDGMQHFKPNNFFGGEAAFKIQVKNDIIKDKKIKQADCISHFIRFNYRETLTKEHIKSRLLEEGVI